MRLAHLLALSLTLAALWACSGVCETECGLRSVTADCAELQRAENATVAAYAALDWPACEALRGYQVTMVEPTLTSPEGRPCYPSHVPGYVCLYGHADCERGGISLVSLDLLPHETGHVLVGCEWGHEGWTRFGFDVAEGNAMGLLALTGSAGGTE